MYHLIATISGEEYKVSDYSEKLHGVEFQDKETLEIVFIPFENIKYIKRINSHE